MSDRKHTTGTIAGHSFSLRMDADAPDALVADIEAALASVKAGGCTPNSELRELVSEWREKRERISHPPVSGKIKELTDELEALIDDDTQAGDGE